ncbi:NAD-dependent dehydratase [Chryseobacterium lactis]|uniref:NAD-dependent dehydratase n=1 Tax=Chryseobacterium lactis TaxID=1241981 RepID=A0A3G6RIJ5_CHRLC|nr:NAD(P)H-binding protein [Chryseobacterium lactis]AZA84413.1 NAD-dependent epimerase/dehydratase family protein [Chryseobacterium lactis]AZB04801.1 NAD-dependent epimerase/dehydratase family protein [Chryseobacterium lactis]PNW14532.1 NAD-dependent dehydratase [Chryseobacterium lactis]
MNIVLTGSVGNIGKPLTQQLVEKGHSVTVISSNEERISAIEMLGAKAAIGSMFDPDFLAKTFKGADIVYLMETIEAAGDLFDKDVDFIGAISEIGHHYKAAVEKSGVKKMIHLSSIGAHTDQGTGIIIFHHHVENILKQLPDEVDIKFIRPVGIYFNMFSFINTIKNTGAIISNYGGDQKEPWVSPLDIAEVVVEEIEKPFEGRVVRYVASDEVSPNEIAKTLGNSIGKPGLQWNVISDDELLKSWLKIGFNEQVAKGFVETQAAQGTGVLYEDYYQHQPVLGKVKLADFAEEFAAAYKNDEVGK